MALSVTRLQHLHTYIYVCVLNVAAVLHSSVEVDIHQLPHDSRTIALSSPENIAERLIAAGIDRDREELVHSLSCSSRQEEEQEDDSDSVEVAELDTTSSEGF